MYIIIKVKDTDNIIGLKEEIAMRLEDVVGIERIDVKTNAECRVQNAELGGMTYSRT